MHWLPGRFLQQQDALSNRIGAPLFSPLHQANQHRVKIHPRIGQTVFKGALVITAGYFFQHPSLGQFFQPGTEHTTGNIQLFLKGIKGTHAMKGIAQNKKGPPLADDIQRLCDAAVHMIKRCSGHADLQQGIPRLAPGIPKRIYSMPLRRARIICSA